MCVVGRKEAGHKPWRLPNTDTYFCGYVQFSRPVVSDSLRPHELQHTRPPCVGMLEIQNLVTM